MNIKMNYISVEEAKQVAEILKGVGTPTENRVLILTPTDEASVGGIIIPGTADDSRPKKGVVITAGYMDENYNSYRELVKVGNILTYGLYAGKEVEFNDEIFPIELRMKLSGQKFSVLSLNEVIFAEVNNN